MALSDFGCSSIAAATSPSQLFNGRFVSDRAMFRSGFPLVASISVGELAVGVCGVAMTPMVNGLPLVELNALTLAATVMPSSAEPLRAGSYRLLMPRRLHRDFLPEVLQFETASSCKDFEVPLLVHHPSKKPHASTHGEYELLKCVVSTASEFSDGAILLTI
jgi:hypothetical protein